MELRKSAPSETPAMVLKDRVVQILLDSSRLLQQATTVHQAKLIADIAAAQQVYAKRQQLGEEVEAYAYALKTDALSRLGEILRDMPRSEGTRLAGRVKGSNSGVGGTKTERPTDAPTLAELGIDRKTAAVAQQLAALAPDVRQAIASQETTLAAVRRERKAVEVRKAISLPSAKYRVLYADPPWAYNDKADAGSVQAGGAARHYPTMPIAELCAMKVADLCEPNAVLFLWVTSPLLFESAALIAAWGFTYKASFVWDKVKHNMGHYNSVRHEFLLICTRGSCTPDVVQLLDSVQSIERGEHSAKPPEFRRIIETLYPHGKRLELFARERAEGWDAYGYETDRKAGVA